MRFSFTAFAASLGFIASAEAYNKVRQFANGTTINVDIEVVLILTLPCPVATVITTNNATYTAAAGETLTISNCPCTVTKAVSSSTTGLGSASSSELPIETAAGIPGPELVTTSGGSALQGGSVALILGVLGLAGLML